MRIHALSAAGFRNLEEVLVEPHPRFNVIWGDNAQGKTNLLEAIYLLGSLRSFRAGKNDELVGFGKERAWVRARVEKLGIQRLLEVVLAGHQKRARVDGKSARASEYFGGFNVVLFAPEDLRLPKGPPAGRRRFLDRAIWNAEGGYLEVAQTYDRILRTRNALLRARTGPVDAMQLEVYDAQLADAAKPVIAARTRFVQAIGPRVSQAWSRITQTGMTLEMIYERAFDGDLRERFMAERGKDLARGATSSGPHTDDLEWMLDGKPARLYASQGQLRALVLALKIAEIEHVTEAIGDPPVLLLDDVSSELDATRNRQLFEFLSSVTCQTFITTTDPAHIRIANEVHSYRVQGGRIFK